MDINFWGDIIQLNIKAMEAHSVLRDTVPFLSGEKVQRCGSVDSTAMLPQAKPRSLPSSQEEPEDVRRQGQPVP